MRLAAPPAVAPRLPSRGHARRRALRCPQSRFTRVRAARSLAAHSLGLNTRVLTVATLPRAGSRWSPLPPVSRSAPCRRSADTPLALAGSPVYHTPAPLSGVRLRAPPVGAYHPPPAAVVAAHLPAPVPVFAPASPVSRVCLPPPPGGGGAGGNHTAVGGVGSVPCSLSIRDLTLHPLSAYPAVFPRFSASLRARNLLSADIALACQHFLAVRTVLLEMRSPLRR